MKAQRLNILLTLEVLVVGGTEIHALEVSRELMNRGHKVVICCLGEGPLASSFQVLGCAVYTNCSSATLKEIIQNEEIHLIHSHDISVLKAKNVCAELKIPLIYTVHGSYHQLFGELNLEQTSIISVSPAIQRWIHHLGVKSTLVSVPINLEKFHFTNRCIVRNELSINDKAPVVLYAARLGDEIKQEIAKKVLFACQLLKEELLPELQVIFVGGSSSDPAVGPLVELAQAMNAMKEQPFVHLIGERNDMVDIYSASDVVVGTGTVAIEAMACERTVIAAGVKGYVGIIDPTAYQDAKQKNFGDHESDVPLTVESFTEDILEVLTKIDQYNKLGKVHREFISSEYDIKQAVEKILYVYYSQLS